jgi:hypothetical protein
MSKLNIAVLGDSIMWGQGLRTENKFFFLAANRIAEALGRELNIEPSACAPRSGAKIQSPKQSDIGKSIAIDKATASKYNVVVNEEPVVIKAVQVTLPSGKPWNSPEGDRAEFYDNYPAFFQTDEQALAFFDGSNEEVAVQLFGDIPCTFPTVTYQVKRVDDEVGRNIDLVFINGSANDVDFEQVLNPLSGPDIEKIDVMLFQFTFLALKDLITEARNKFPNAIIFVTGYFSAFSQSSDRGQLEDFAKYISGKSEAELIVNDVLTSWWAEIPIFPPLFIFSKLGELFHKTHDVSEALSEAISRSEYAHSRALYWIRRAVTESYESDKRGPGIYFVSPSFRPESSLFAPTAFVREGYKPPSEDDHVVNDPILEERLNRIPRNILLPDFIEVEFDLVVSLFLTEKISDLFYKLDGSTSLKNALNNFLQNIESYIDYSNISDAIDALKHEIGRILHGQIASFLHPNEAGAQRYADKIVERFNQHSLVGLRDNLTRMESFNPQQPPQFISVKDIMHQYGFDPAIGLHAFMQHMIVDSLAITMKGKCTSDTELEVLIFAAKVFLNTGNGMRWQLDNPSGVLNTFETFGALHIGDIKQLALELESNSLIQGELEMDVEDFSLLINGKTVFSSPGMSTLRSSKPLIFPYQGLLLL